MVAVMLTVLMCLVVAGAVLLVASVATERVSPAPDESSWQAFRRGLSSMRGGRSTTARAAEEAALAAELAAAEPVDVSLAELLRAAADDGEPYLRPDELTLTLHRARDKAVRAEQRVLPLGHDRG